MNNPRMLLKNKLRQRSKNLDELEIKKFDHLAQDWRNPNGRFASVLAFNEVRLHYIKSIISEHFGSKTISILDVGCGAGLLTQPLAEMGNDVLGIDASEINIQVATHHGKHIENLRYRHTLSDELLREGKVYDLVLNTEVVEHVPKPNELLAECGRLVSDKGVMITATLNRTLSSYLIGIIGAEYIVKALPVGTHNWHSFVTPNEVKMALQPYNFCFGDTQGMSYNPLTMKWRTTTNDKVNYLLPAYKCYKAVKV